MNRPFCPPTIAAVRPGVPLGRRLAHWLLLGLAVAAPGASIGADADAEHKREAEIEVQLPPFPQPENLIPFVVSATTDNRFMIDGASLSVGKDRVVRYTLVVVSPYGAQNISYEAINCSTGERRIHALGRSDKTWSKARNDQWVKIRDNTLNRQHAALFNEYFCPPGLPAQTANELRQSLRNGGERPTNRP